MADNPVTAYGLLATIFYFLLNAVLGERKTSRDEEQVEDPGKLVKNAVGAAFVDKSTADLIAQIAADVETIRSVVVDNAEAAEEEGRVRQMKEVADNEIRRVLGHLDKQGPHDRGQKTED